MNLPIDIIPGTNPPKFRWRQTVSTPNGLRVVDHTGNLPPTVEGAVLLLITLARQWSFELADQKKETEGLHAQLLAATDRIAKQSELLSQRAEAQPSRKSKG